MTDQNILILGGCGFIGRNFLKFLIDNQLGGKIRVVDKSRPELGYMTRGENGQLELYKHERVEYIQADLAKPDNVAKRAFGGDTKWNYVVNLCGETRFGLSPKDYELKVELTAKNCAAAAAEYGITRWVEVSTAQVYKPDKKPSSEKDALKPWTQNAEWRLKAENIVSETKGLDFVILRPSYVYGTGDLTSIAPRIVCGAIYQNLGEQMQFLWTKDLLLGVVHVEDLCAAIWLASTGMKAGSVYNVDEGSGLNQGGLAEMLEAVFGIKTSFIGSLMSTAASTQLSKVADMANEKHVPAWATLCNGLNTPLSPYLDKELLKNQHMSIDGSQITKDYDFKYAHQINVDWVQQFVDEARAQGIFPPPAAPPAASTKS